ncbi:glycosyltransferase family 4 protein [Paracoccus sp. 1_MG-2023]|uniref:glycosyltransferase family 4 protein n=1 Tax=unclassified Paracoccus (in: a-proteobacteria) TaxID=2688777 RepID=UPI001C095353|nr:MULTISPECIES: glycosyltransferase family 4 protein [unclassified Paracoccus (in: a-proteobacteria)]MBU2956558.1 glycosyltransferase family 4 protein [Paracoccus sp. C2R09]MDO6668664.1 glycosyltransferase family 4 protein [Paracoccus sp. 1_MG-2023]
MTSHQRPTTFVLPGNIETVTGGYLYDRNLVEHLRLAGRDMQVLSLADSFPTPDDAQMAHATKALQGIDPGRIAIIDGLALGALRTDELKRVAAPMVAMIHHPLAQESALPADLRQHLFTTERGNLRLVRHILVPSPHTRQMLIDRYDVAADRITVARPGTQARAAAPARHRTPPLILSVGILHPRKGHDLLLAALARLTDMEWRAVIAGNPWDDDHVRMLKDQIAASWFADRVDLAGRVDDARLQDLYSRASIFTLATRYEGYGIVFDEALSHGVPIVSTRVGAVPDTVPGDAGILVAPENIAELSEALRQLLQDDARRDRMAEAAWMAGRDLPDWHDTARTVGMALEGID